MINQDIRTKIKFKKKEDGNYNCWESPQYALDLNNQIYKYQLLDKINKLLENGIESKNIFIMQNNFSNQDSIRYLKESKNNRHFLYNMCYFGEATSLSPNTYTSNLLILLSFHRNFNNLCKEYGDCNGISNEFFNDVIFKHLNNGSESVKECLALLNKRVQEIISKYISNNSRNEKLRDLELIINTAREQIHVISSRQGSVFRKVEKARKRGNYETLRTNEKDLYDDIYRKFFSILENNFRPIVVYYDGHVFRVAAQDMIVYNEENINDFLDLIQFSHQSPPVYEYLIKVSFIISMLAGGASHIANETVNTIAIYNSDRREEELHPLKKEKLEEDILKVKRENRTTSLDRIEQALHQDIELTKEKIAKNLLNDYEITSDTDDWL